MRTRAVKLLAPVVVTLCMGLVVLGSGCDQRAENKPPKETAQPMKTIDEVIKLHADSLMAIPGVVGVYHGLNQTGASCLKVMVKKMEPGLADRIPRNIEGYDVVIEETGEIKPMK